jgi:D-glycero-alpha-D-manno-heptose-7-phosphate kinase
MTDLNNILAKTEINASAPCRVDMGGTLDLSTFYLPLRHLAPCTFNAALNLRTRVRLRPYKKGKIKISSRGFDSLEVESHTAPFTPPLGLMLAVAAYFNADGVHIEIDSASPPRSALGGSSVAAVALVWAFGKARAAAGRPAMEPVQAALLAHAIEQSVAGVPCGIQDQLAAAFGGVNAWYWSGQPGPASFTRDVLIPAGESARFSDRILVAYCGEPHESRDINGTWVRDFVAGRHRKIWAEIIDCSRRFIRAVVDGHYEDAVDAMNRETDLRCRMTPDVLETMGTRLVQAAREQQCGARFTGAGGGGCLWALGGTDHIRELRHVWRQLLAERPYAALLETAVDTAGVL